MVHEVNTSGASKQKLKQAAQVARTAQLPRERGRDHLSSLSEHLARDLACDYIEAKFTGKPARCPIAPIAETAIIHDKIRVNLNHRPILSSDVGSGAENLHNLSLVMPLLDNVLLTTAADTSPVIVDTSINLGPNLLTKFRTSNADGSSTWPISNDIAFFSGYSRAQFPYVVTENNRTHTGYQVFDNAAITGVGSQTKFFLRGVVDITESNETTGYRNWNLNYATLDASGAVLETGFVTMASGFTQFSPGGFNQFALTNEFPWHGSEEAITFWLTTPISAVVAEVRGNLSFSLCTASAADVKHATWYIPQTMRHLQTHTASTFAEVPADQYAIRELTSLFTFDGPYLAQGGFVAITEVKARETMDRTDLVDWAGSRSRSYYGKVVEGAYGVWIEDTLNDFAFRSICEPYESDTKYLMCASTITDGNQALNLVAIVDFSYEFLTNSLLHEKSFAVPAAYPQLVHAIISSMPRFSSNDDHKTAVVRPAMRLRNEAAKSQAAPTPWWKRLLNTIGKVGKAILPVLPAIIAAL
jgi:hypothetical protein